MVARFGVHAHGHFVLGNEFTINFNDSGLNDVLFMTRTIAQNGGSVIRADTSWSAWQREPEVREDDSYFFSDTPPNPNTEQEEYLAHLGRRGHLNSDNEPEFLDLVYETFRDVGNEGVNTIFNFGFAPDWATTTDTAGDDNRISDPDLVGQYLFDLIYHIGQKEDGLDVLEKVEGWQIFNEISVTYGGEGQPPYSDYLDILVSANKYVEAAYVAIGLEGEARENAPDLIGPTLGGAYNEGFWEAFKEYNDANDNAAAEILSEGGLDIHPYNNIVASWRDPNTGELLDSGVDLQTDNLTFHRSLNPTDDYVSWVNLTEREGAEEFGIRLFSESDNPADEYFDYTTEVGTERTMATLYQSGLDNVEVHFTEWGATSWGGSTDQANTGTNLWNSLFADPFKYEYTDPQGGEPQSQEVSENLQADAFLQTLGLIEDWDFVDTATAFEFYDNEGLSESDAGYFGLYDIDGRLKPAGEAYFAYLKGETYAYDSGETGVDLRITQTDQAEFIQGAETAELTLLRGGNDYIVANGGDDTVFGGDGNDVAEGGSGYDRLYGGTGNDRLIGGEGADKLKGGSGNDVLIGGAGKDQFSFAVYSADGTGHSGNDIIEDFTKGEDILSLTGSWSAENIIQNAIDIDGDTLLTLGDNGSTVLLKGVLKENLDASDFYILQADSTTTTVQPPEPPAPSTSPTVNNDVIEGTAERDVIDALAGDDEIRALAGNDRLIGGLGADLLDGGEGVDTAEYTRSAEAVRINLGAAVTDSQHASGGEAEGDRLVSIENIYASSFDDVITAQDADIANRFEGRGGNDTLSGLGGEDVLLGSTGNDILEGGTGNDRLFGGADSDTLYGGEGDDYLVGGEQNSTEAKDIIDGGNGIDTAVYRNSAAFVDIDLLTEAGLGGSAEGDQLIDIENLIGSRHNDILRGDNLENVLTGEDGADQLLGRSGDDTLYGGDGDDTLLAGGNGDDVIFGGEGDDILEGQAHDDILIGNRGADQLDGGTGSDTASYEGSRSRVIVDISGEEGRGTGGDASGDVLINIENLIGSAHNDTLTGNDQSNTLNGEAGSDIISAGGGSDTIYGGDGDDRRLDGGDGDDIIFGGSGDDFLRGGNDDDGQDRLNGGEGNDRLQGGDGADTFIIEENHGQDVIIDFESEDVVDLSSFGITDFTTLQTFMSDDGDDAVIQFDDDNSLRFFNVSANELVADDFLLG